MSGKAQHPEELAVKELRLFLALYRGADVAPDSRLGRQIEAAGKAVAGYEKIEKHSGTAASA